MKRVSTGLIATILFLSGCAVGPNFKRPVTTVSPQWTVEPATGTSTGEPAEQWWRSFNDPEFDKLVQQAVKANLDLQLAAARVDEARAARGIAKSGLFPTVDASVSASRNRQRVVAPVAGPGSSAKILPIEFSNFQGGFDAAWEVDVFGRVRRGLQAATADLATASEARREVLVTLLGELGRSYAELRGFQLRLDIAQKNIAIQQDTVELTKARTKAGLSSELDVARALAQLETTKSAVPTLQSGIETSIHRLSVLLGQEPGALRAELLPGAPVPVTPPDVPVGLPSQLIERRPDIRQAESQIAAATARVGEAKAEFFPRFLLLGTAGRQASQLHDITLGMGNFFGAGPVVTLPIFTGGRIRSQVRVQDARLQQSVIAYRSTVLSALEETENALVSYAQEQARHDRLESAVRSNEEAVELSSELYKAGLTDFLSVLDAQRELYATEDLLAQSRTAETVNLIALYKALGGGWQSFQP
jgi:NodT family efflux transporter outer membrane factor (OMF) lipoprotein